MVSGQTCHISFTKDSRDGGITSAVHGLVDAQKQAGLAPQWLQADQLDQLAGLEPNATVLHLHGLWRRPTRHASRWSSVGFPCVIAPHGMLDPWAVANSRWRKQLVWQLWERRALEDARCLQALCPAEAAAIRGMLPHTAIAVIPNGIRLPAPDGQRHEGSSLGAVPPWAGAIPEGDSVLLFLGRFHAKKGLIPLLEAWRNVAAQAQRAGWWLALVGYGDGGSLQRRLQSEPITNALAFGPVFGDIKEATLAASSAFVLPSHSEGLPMAALEAMAHRLPCLLSSACNLPIAFQAGAALAAEPDPAHLQASLGSLLALSPAERAAMGAAGQALVREHYTWPQVVEQTHQLYRWLLGGGDRPGFVEE